MTDASEALRVLDEKVEACRECLFWKAASDSGTGICRRFPPIGGNTRYRETGEPRWPWVNSYDWCGEFRALSAGGRE